jgi:SAM-dependent methyltransferase
VVTDTGSAVYSKEFFAGQVEESASSAAVVVPLVLSLLPVKSVVDVGCGVAPWAAAFRANGVPAVWGIDGDYIDRSQLRIPSDRFLGRDLTQPLEFDRTFDLAVCLEVAEHLPESRAEGLVADLTSLAPCVLFSAAVPGQGGTHHINEQYLSYWVNLFQKRGYQGIDSIRPWILGNDAVEWFYQQNIVMFVAGNHALLDRNFPRLQTIIHPRLYERARTGEMLTLGTLARAFPSVAVRSIRYHLGFRRPRAN